MTRSSVLLSSLAKVEALVRTVVGSAAAMVVALVEVVGRTLDTELEVRDSLRSRCQFFHHSVVFQYCERQGWGRKLRVNDGGVEYSSYHDEVF